MQQNIDACIEKAVSVLYTNISSQQLRLLTNTSYANIVIMQLYSEENLW